MSLGRGLMLHFNPSCRKLDEQEYKISGHDNKAPFAFQTWKKRCRPPSRGSLKPCLQGTSYVRLITANIAACRMVICLGAQPMTRDWVLRRFEGPLQTPAKTKSTVTFAMNRSTNDRANVLYNDIIATDLTSSSNISGSTRVN